MTNKDTIEWLMVVKDKFIPKDDDWYDEKYREAIDKAIITLEQEPNIDMHSEEIKILQKRSYLEGFHEALKMSVKQEPCEDCISRADVIDLCDSKDSEYKVAHFKEDVECLPPVTPKPKTGHWIENKGKDIRDKFYTCSKCGRTINIICGDTLENYPFCHCGADMTESEDKE